MIYFYNNNKININNISYTIQAFAQANIVDSFVDPANKIGSGSGEARLYVSSQSMTPIFTFNPNIPQIIKGRKSYVACEHKCFLSKDNLIKYMEDAEIDYFSPNRNYRQNIANLYDYRLNTIYNLTQDEIFFQIYNQNGDFDSSRFYIGSIDYAWSLIRELSLPKLTYVNIYKLVNDINPSDIMYYFELNHISNTSNHLNYSKQTSNLLTETIIKNDTTITNTEKETIINARLGQGKFRSNVLSIMPQCPFTLISEPFLLRASHIKPWANCLTNYERLDGFNGLTLSPTYDILFDRGLISFSNNGELLLSKFLPSTIKEALNLTPGRKYDLANFNGEKNIYLDYHRNYVLKK
ncbi:HNH endonuclease [Clostridium sp. DSM 100503]|uniref:HNH endonuclease n=1 Tax=Clostridium sp. DSM 100503 TaxID=2963282 RepID=UPI00214A1CFD|nr:HNH endonuclease [Clostridium sp. DSM 100503]MCR1952070.1 HNH endonuclease [Clostridium sp. DSM 100503]